MKLNGQDNDYRFILYLDLDGVMTSEEYIIKIHEAFIDGLDELGYDKSFRYRNFMHQYCFQEEAVDCLNKVYDVCPYAIVISSTRRFEFTIDEWNLVFRLNKIKPKVIGRTQKLEHYKNDKYAWREDEIEAYHKNSKDIPFIIIDDDSFDLQMYADKLINVSTITGLTENYLEEIFEKLKKQGVE